ncbi:flagellar biosynthesis protein FlhA, partial [bacterium]|nr:flagellar biosynthesis protein FlhA [bacterium]
MEFVSKYSDLFLAAIVVLVVGIMIIPLPTFIIDILLTINVAFGITLLLVVLYISTALKLASFPSLLLMATLFRLGLNVSTTRLILLQGDAGEMIHSFGKFVVQGNIIVGAIVFLILTLINFIVIAKGSERVAEVAARFTLDAMPGKQMAIDADLRAGVFDMEEAKVHRRNLSRESQLFGAMDGAMKFVKGDAIAGIIITCVNIIGGVSVGVLLRGMDGLEALRHFGLLTIGDGLLSQIPALIISSAAGLMVTRVEPETPGDHLGQDISLQLLGYPKALIIVSMLLFALGIIPGLPLIPFWCIATICGGISFSMQRLKKCVEEDGDIICTKNGSGEKNKNSMMFSIPAPITLILSPALADTLGIKELECEFLACHMPNIRQEIYNELGIQVPGIKVIEDTSVSNELSFEICIMDSPVYKGVIPENSGFIQESDERLLLIAGRSEVTDDTYPCNGTIVQEDAFQRLEDAGYRIFSGPVLLSFLLKNVLTGYAAEFLGLQEIKWMCDELEKYCPDTVNEVIPGKISYPRLCDILRRLIQEKV